MILPLLMLGVICSEAIPHSSPGPHYCVQIFAPEQQFSHLKFDALLCGAKAECRWSIGDKLGGAVAVALKQLYLVSNYINEW